MLNLWYKCHKFLCSLIKQRKPNSNHKHLYHIQAHDYHHKRYYDYKVKWWWRFWHNSSKFKESHHEKKRKNITTRTTTRLSSFWWFLIIFVKLFYIWFNHWKVDSWSMTYTSSIDVKIWAPWAIRGSRKSRPFLNSISSLAFCNCFKVEIFNFIRNGQ